MEPALASAYAYFQQNSPENYRFLDFYRHRQNQIDFTYDFRSEAFALRKCLEFMVEHEVDNVKQGRHRLAGSMEGPVKSREGEIYFHDYGGCLRAVHFKGVIPSWSASLAGSASLTEVGPPRVPRRGNMLTQLWRVPTCHLTLWRSLDPVVVCLNHRVKCLDVDEFWNSIEIRYANRKKYRTKSSTYRIFRDSATMPNAESYFEENNSWSLLDYLKYREDALDFENKVEEHRSYFKVLGKMLHDKSEEKRTKAEVSLENYEVCINPYYWLRWVVRGLEYVPL
ncbi:hypothetical protein BC938DRAFT_481360 [Jimgerdemannia flammicorona]|uniref:Uncharacterized protein n=1 Tax=Jimgerdemannia flammicorona TaxID=994334 RepID=A0A433QWW5_9FUNG|nr:hypothetical protein BC938DRAFT_481360 [Jimgerdemannia flammicorona]